MTYLEEILMQQTMLALTADGEAAKLPRQGVTVVSEEAAENSFGTAQEGIAHVRQDGQAQLLKSYTELVESAERLTAIRQQARTVQQPMQVQTDAPQMLWQPDRMDGGLVARSVSMLQTTGAAGYDTRRSMAEISRFFERDARRYGGI